jgi:hypothetical protein
MEIKIREDCPKQHWSSSSTPKGCPDCDGTGYVERWVSTSEFWDRLRERD